MKSINNVINIYVFKYVLNLLKKKKKKKKKKKLKYYY